MQKKKQIDKNKADVLSTLLENEQFKKLYSLYKNLVIEQSKSEFFGQDFDKKKLQDCQNDLCKIISENTHFKDSPMSLFESTILCEKCNDNFFVDGQPCTCLKNEISKLLKSESNLSEFKTFEESNFDLFKDKTKYKKLYDIAQKWCDTPQSSKIVNFGFFGNTGNGKTFLMQCMADRLIKNGYCIYFTTAFNMLDKIFKGNAENDSDLIKTFINCDILFIDDLGTEKYFKNQNENNLFNIINQRMIQNKPIIFSTNLELEDFLEKYGERIFSRLINKQKSKIILFDENDFRIKLK